MIFKVFYESFGEGEMVINIDDIECFKNVQELINDNSALEEYVFEKLENDGKITKEDVFNWFNHDDEYLTFVAEADSEDEFLKVNYNLTTFEELKNRIVEDNTVYLFRYYQYSKNVLLATFVGFDSITDIKNFCIENNLNYSEFKGSQFSLYEFNNCVFYDKDDDFNIETLEGILFAENYDAFEKE